MNSDPLESELTAHFWDSTRRHELVYPYCAHCQRAFFVPQVICPRCRRGGWEWRASAGEGSVETFTWIDRPPTPDFELPYCLAVVSMDEGWHLMTNIVGTEPGGVDIGDRVGLHWIVRGDRTLPGFARVGGSR